MTGKIYHSMSELSEFPSHYSYQTGTFPMGFFVSALECMKLGHMGAQHQPQSLHATLFMNPCTGFEAACVFNGQASSLAPNTDFVNKCCSNKLIRGADLAGMLLCTTASCVPAVFKDCLNRTYISELIHLNHYMITHASC